MTCHRHVIHYRAAAALPLKLPRCSLIRALLHMFFDRLTPNAEISPHWGCWLVIWKTGGEVLFQNLYPSVQVFVCGTAECRVVCRGCIRGVLLHISLLTDSLEIYCNIVGEHFFGAKKALRYMQQYAPDAAAVYDAALSSPTSENLQRWIEILEKNFATRFPDN